MDGCFSVYVLNTTEALFLFFKQRNLEGGGSEDGQKYRGGGRERQTERERSETF